MKMRDIITESVDMSFWRELDAKFNPDALKYINKEEERQKKMQEVPGTPIYTDATKEKPSFNTKPSKDDIKSSGYRGLVDTHVKSGHISRKKGRKLAGARSPIDPQKSFLPHR